MSALPGLLAETLRWLATRPDALAFAGGAPEVGAQRTPTPQTRAVVARLAEARAGASTATAPVVEALIAAAPELTWNCTYSDADVGGDFLNGYGWVDLIGATGPYDGPVRAMFGHWKGGLEYQVHWHAPEEAYLPIAGRAWMWSETQGERLIGPGDIFVNGPNEKHSLKMTEGPFTTFALWKGPSTRVETTIRSRTTGEMVRAGGGVL